MRTLRFLVLPLAIGCLLGLPGCGADKEFLAAVQVTPAGGTANAGSGNNMVQFTAIGWYAPIAGCGYGGCGLGNVNKSQKLTSASWMTSDKVATSVDATGLATCLSATSVPATITATAEGGLYGPIQGTATMVCN